MKGWLVQVVNVINDLGNWINNNIAIPLSNAVKSISGTLTDLGGSISQGFTAVSTQLTAWANGIVTSIEQGVAGIGTSISDWAKSVGESISSGVKSIQETMAKNNEWISLNIGIPLGNLGKSLSDGLGWVYEQIKAYQDQKSFEMLTGVQTGNKDVITYMTEKIDFIGGKISDILAGIAGALGSGLQMVATWLLEHLTWLGEMIVGAVNAVVSAIGGAFNTLVSGFINTITKAMMPGSPDPAMKQAVSSMVEISWDRQIQIIKEAYKSAPTPESIKKAALDTISILTVGAVGALVISAAADLAHPLKIPGFQRTIREALWMIGVPAVTASIITMPSAVGLLIPLRYALMESLQPMQAGASDIVRFAVRETFDPVRRKDLLAFYPGEEYTHAMAREGFSRTWAEHFWGAHWVLPPITQLNEYLYRHDDFIDMWRKYIRYEDYIPESIPWLEEIIHPPWTRVDIRRMWEMGVITEADMIREYRWGGYDQAHAELLGLWTKIYVAAPDLKARYRNGWISSDDMRAELVRLGMPGERVDEFMQTFIAVDKPERTTKEKDLTKTDILKLYRVGQIDLAAARGFLLALGYDESEAGYLLALEADKMTTELKDLTSAQILKAYRFEVLTREEAKDKLQIAGWTEAAAETMLKLEDVNLADGKVDKMRERDLSLTQIIQAVGRAIITLDVGKQYLAYLGYSPWEITVILTLEGLA